MCDDSKIITDNTSDNNSDDNTYWICQKCKKVNSKKQHNDNLFDCLATLQCVKCGTQSLRQSIYDANDITDSEDDDDKNENEINDVIELCWDCELCKTINNLKDSVMDRQFACLNPECHGQYNPKTYKEKYSNKWETYNSIIERQMENEDVIKSIQANNNENVVWICDCNYTNCLDWEACDYCFTAKPCFSVNVQIVSILPSRIVRFDDE